MGLFGPEKMILMLEKYDYKPGDSIKGTVKLQLKKPTNARKLVVGFIGRKVERQGGGINIGGGGKNTKSTNYSTIFDFTMPLDGEKEYHEGTYPFEIKIPPNILQGEPQQLTGNVATAVNVLKVLGGVSSHVEWMVVAQLDLPLKVDISASQKVILS